MKYKVLYILGSLLLLASAFLIGRRSVKVFPYSLLRGKELPNRQVNTGKRGFLTDKYTFQTDNYKVYNGQYDIVMLGTSITQYVYWNELLNRCDVANRGVGGDITAGYLHRIGSVLSCRPKLCFVEASSNDVQFKTNYSEFIQGLAKVIDTLEQSNIKICVFSIFHCGSNYVWSAEVNDRITKYNFGVDSLCKQKNVQVFDMNKYLAPNGVLLAQYAKKDGIHLSGDGYKIWGQKVNELIASIL